MKQKVLIMGLICALSLSLFAGCGKETKNTTEATQKEVSSKTDKKEKKDEKKKSEEFETLEVTEEATTETAEDGSLVVTTESGEKIVVSESTQKTTNADGSVTYTTTEGQKVTIKENGTATVTEEVKVPASTETASGSSETAHKHSYSKTVTKEATCKEAGVRTFSCSCGSEYTESIPKTENHVSGDWQVTVQPTENSTGTKVKNCTVCGKQLESASIDKVAHSHNYAWVESGNTRTMKCSCGASKGVTETNYGGHWGYFDSGMASSLFNECNDARGYAQYVERDPLGNIIYAGNVQAVSRDSSLDSLAERRATEVLSNWSHQGRDLDSYYTTENLAKGFNSALDVRCAWAASHDHAGTMVYQYYTKAGAAWFWWDADNTGENLVGVAVMEYSE